MKMDGRESAECQNWEKNDINVIYGIILVRKRQKGGIVVVFFKYQKRKTSKAREGGSSHFRLVL